MVDDARLTNLISAYRRYEAKGMLLPLDFLKYLLVSSITYYLISFVLTPNTLSPLHQDDYFMLGAGFENLRWWVARPVSTNLVYIMGEMGSTFSFALVNLLTAAIPAMVLYFVAQLLRVKLGWVLAAAFSVMVFSHSAAFEHGKFLGLITNLTSHFFGCLALIGLLRAQRNPTLANNALAVLAYGLSVFAKEDFLLPPLLLLVYFGAALYYRGGSSALHVAGDKSLEQKWWLKIALWLVALAGASFLFSLLVRNPFLTGLFGQVGSAAPYAVSFHLSELIASFLRLTVGFSLWQTVAGGAAGIVLGVIWKDRRRELLLLATIVFSLLLPYALIPHRILPYRVFAWLPWFSVFVVVSVSLFWRGGIRILAGRPAKVFAVALLLVPFLIGYLDHPHRMIVAAWYTANQSVNQLMLDSILANKALLNAEAVVGVVGVAGLSPWSNNDGAYLRKLGFENRWIVFVDESTIFFTIKESVPLPYLSVVSSQRLREWPGLLIMKFDPSGMGIPIRADELGSIRGSHD